MRRFYFDIALNNEIKEDTEGVDLLDDGAARREAVLTIASIAAEAIPQDGPLNIAISVLDEREVQVFRARVTFDFDDSKKTRQAARLQRHKVE
ncbi:hypothetical protein ASD83_12475 [Devosia sp. Root685]|uniref:DUF6894 family protein n=1 Tax=Devosia sp. Root685 TaxID=1736587 RepID=UPI00070115FE|nr:hypothetical protein [Devosia sp. Root685]KRA97885.1 hypothetical protein ASD83_12475 [Devosia sp. Root685]